MVTNKVKELITPHFIGIGVKCATEAAAHTIRTILENTNNLSGKVLAKLDLSNAFNSNLRSHAREAVSTYLPELLPIFDTCYTTHSFLYCQNNIILKSMSGQQQGACLAPIFFNISLFHFRQNNLELFNNLFLDFCYHDDMCIIGNPSSINYFIHNCSKKLKTQTGLKLNISKTHLYYDPKVTKVGNIFQSLQDLNIHKNVNIDFVGAVIGDAEFTTNYLDQHVLEKHETYLSKLLNINDTQIQYLLFRYTASFCRGGVCYKGYTSIFS